MSVIVKSVDVGSPAYKCGIRSGDTLISINGNEIVDVLDYRFYQSDSKLKLEFISADGKIRQKTARKKEYDELGLEFETYLMDKQHSCRNNCVFCFIDQMPPGMRQTLYFKDDDSRLSFLFGNYITLTNITEHEIERIIKMHISPINISVHTTNPELRVKMMKNRFAGKVLSIMDRFNSAGIAMNCQLVLCPGINDGEELRRSLNDLTKMENVHCIAAVPVGLTKYRDNLPDLQSFNKQTASAVLDIMEEFGNMCLDKYGERRVYAADEFYLLAQREIPEADFYGDFLQLENGVGLWSLLRHEARNAIAETDAAPEHRKISVATGKAAYPLLCEIAGDIQQKWPNIDCTVYMIKNNFFGEKITVSGLVTGGDMIDQLKGKDLGSELLIPSSMLRYSGDMFLDDVTVENVEESLNVKLTVVDNNGQDLIDAFLGIQEGK